MAITGISMGMLYALMAMGLTLIVKAVGVDWINKLMPAVVIGPTVAIIGLSLAGIGLAETRSALKNNL